MNIRRTDRGHCRMCDREAWQPFYRLTWQQRGSEQVRAECSRRSLEFKNRNVGRLYALDASTASGTKTEVICSNHLVELQEEIGKVLNEILRS